MVRREAAMRERHGGGQGRSVRVARGILFLVAPPIVPVADAALVERTRRAAHPGLVEHPSAARPGDVHCGGEAPADTAGVHLAALAARAGAVEDAGAGQHAPCVVTAPSQQVPSAASSPSHPGGRWQ